MERSNIYFFPLAVLFLQCTMAGFAKTSRNITTDQAALLSLKSHITSDPYFVLESNWSTSSSVCDWFGVACSLRHHRVTALNLSGMNVTGNLPTQIGNLSFLISLDLSRNNFRGNLPRELANLRRLRVIQLSYNNFTGEIPSELGSLSELRQLSLRNNSFSGVIPSSISNLSMLQNLDLSSNFIQGTIPERFGDLHNLKTLSLSDNELTGSIPSKVFSISTLEGVGLGRNKLSGNLPSDICHNLPSLKVLALSWNELGGPIPRSISNCTQLWRLALSVNKFRGDIPEEIWKLEKLEELYLGENGFSKGVIPQEISRLRNLKVLGLEHTQRIGSIPTALFNITTLQRINLWSNDLEGEIPEEISKLYKLEEIFFSNNSLSGSIPSGMFNLSNLRTLVLRTNQLSGTLPSYMGYGLPNLEFLFLSSNNIGGVIPTSLSNSTRLKQLDLQDNEFYGEIPDSLGDLRLLEHLSLSRNNLTSQGLKFITSLTKCRYLKSLAVIGNPLHGTFPVSIGNFTSLQQFYAYECNIKGSIPSEIGNLSKLIQLSLSDNFLTGEIPSTMKTIQVLYIDGNSIDGSTLYTLCELQSLILLDLSRNNLSRPLPDCLGKVTSLRHLSFQNCGLTSIPPSIWSLGNLLRLRLSSNSLHGSLPIEIGSLKAAVHIDLSMNQFLGEIPNVFAELINLEYLHLDHNRLEGSIPESLGKVVGLKDLDLSNNNLSGSIPKSLESLIYLKNLNVSFNDLEGEIPFDGPFKNFTSQSFAFNKGLCGNSWFQVPPCPVVSADKRSRKLLQLILIPLGIAMLILSIVFTFLLKRYRRKSKASSVSTPFSLTRRERFSYFDLLKATNHYSESNLLGSGSFGSVYIGVLNEVSVAVKVFNLQRENAFKSFETECEALRNLRHRNLTKVISSCCTEDFKALVLQYMSNGSLEKWLYSHNNFLSFSQRLDIMIDVACALEYLHHGYTTPLVHCDLKPSNVLLDEDMVAHVSDFGIAKLLGEGESISHTITLATLGYIAPEYGSEGLVSTRCDVYSFGIMMMEVFTRTKPSDEKFAESLSLKQWVSDSTPHEVFQIMDANIIRPDEQHIAEKLNCLSSIMELALSCSVESPNERINIRDALALLKKIKVQLLAISERS